MCGRFTLTRPNLSDLASELRAELDAETRRSYRPRWNIAPTTTSVIAKLDGTVIKVVSARFGADAPGGAFVINARAETASRLRTFRNAYAHCRCVVPADGFYEWKGGRGERRPLWFHDPAGGFSFSPGWRSGTHGVELRDRDHGCERSRPAGPRKNVDAALARCGGGVGCETR